MSVLTDGRTVTIYGQTEVVKDLIAARIASDAPLLFGCEQVAVAGLETDTPVVRYTVDGREYQLRCDVVAGCDGFHGVCRQAIPAAPMRYRSLFLAGDAAHIVPPTGAKGLTWRWPM